MIRVLCCYCYCPQRAIEADEKKTPQGLFYRDLPHFINADGNHLFCRYWIPRTPIRALMMIIHDAGEHSGRYENLVELFLEFSLLVFSHDHVGHGQSEGKRLYISDFRIYVRDCLQHIDIMKRQYPNLKLYTISFSMGGLIQINIMNERPNIVAAAIFMAPLVLMNPESATPIKMFLAKVLYHTLPHLTLGYIDPYAISTNKYEVASYINDPLVCNGPVKIKFAFEVLNALSRIERIFPTISTPLLIMHGDLDSLSDIRGSFIMYGKVASTDKTFKIVQNAFHNLHHEHPVTVNEVLAFVKAWLMERLPSENATNL
ncbi:monoglyceride lipase-like [Hemitrygon akajei]|uniref:monoglyceride lipase-like n=1 Tax=Hemitrygon akajei TaxID=2704970 RepID=UPI003BFA203F